MNTAAIITMILIQGAVTAATIYIYYLILKPQDRNNVEKEKQKDLE